MDSLEAHLEGDRRQEAVAAVQGAQGAAPASPTAPRSTRVERYLILLAARRDGRQCSMSMLEDLADLFEQAAADGTPIARRRRGGPRGVRRGVHPQLRRGRLDRQGARAAGRRGRARRSASADERWGRCAMTAARPPCRARDPRARPDEVVQGPAGAARRRPRRGARAASSPCSARTGPARRPRADPVDAAAGRRGHRRASTVRRHRAGRTRPRVAQPHRAVRRRRRDPHRSGEPRAGRPAPPPRRTRARSRTRCSSASRWPTRRARRCRRTPAACGGGWTSR